MKPKSNSFKSGFIDGIPIGLGYLSVSFSFGIQAHAMGIPILWTLLISMTNLTSAGQASGIGIIAAGGSFIEMALTQLIINSRYFLMSLSLSQKLEGGFTLPHRLAASFGITDEVFALASSKNHKLAPKYMYGLLCAPYIGWSLGTFLGAAAGNLLPDMISDALGIALYGMFIEIVVPPMKKNLRLLAVVSLAIAVSCALYYIPIFDFISSGFSIIISTVIASLFGALLFPVQTEDPDDE
ncbi:MAG: AzlC family ABC transporter permease [Clostridia bacterium]|nr:AzlC family ABC transporter permease [Clostridia bacterium]